MKDKPLNKYTPKDILDRWATAVVPKEAIYLKQGVAGINQDKTVHYEERGYKGDEVLWIPPKDCIRFEFEHSQDANHRFILEIESAAKSLRFDYCITGHGGTSDYFNMFNIEKLPFGEDNQNAKLLLADLLMPSKMKQMLDRTNLGWTLSPIIGHEHWKPKYNGAIHKILRGKHPLEHKNEYPNELLKQLKKSKTQHKTWLVHINQESKWVETFLLEYCCKNSLPKGARHYVIEKNLAAFIINREDKESIKKQYYEAQDRKHDSMHTWEVAILKGDYSNVSAGELAKFIKDYNLPFDVPKLQRVEDIKPEIKLTVDELKDVFKNFEKPNLLELIKKEIDKDHLEDDNLKMTCFLVGISGLLNEPKRRMSMAITGGTSVGKDNLFKSILKHMPDGTWAFLTGATQPAIEDQTVYTKILALSEINLFKDSGANKDLLEVVKQRTEGGTSVIKKDVATQFKTTKREQTEQGTVFYGTTDAERNDETETRFIYGDLEAKESKIRKVNTNTLDSFSNPKKLIEGVKNDSWVKKGLTELEKDDKIDTFLIPFSHLFDTKIDGKDIIDCKNPRSMRDLKRLLSLVCACTWLFSRQRKQVKYEGVNFLVSEPEDLLNTIKYTKEFFNQTYEGMDKRLNQILEILNEQETQGITDWMARDQMQREIKLSINTIKSWCNTLESLGLLETMKGVDLNQMEGAKVYAGNKIYIKRCQKGVKNMLIRCQYLELKGLLESKKGDIKEIVDAFCIGKDISELINGLGGSEIDTFSLTPLEKPKEKDTKKTEKLEENPKIEEEKVL